MDNNSFFESIGGVKMHYTESGAASLPTLVFIHGMPTSSYLWRRVIPLLNPYYHCVAPDLMGMGQSDKPDIEYRIFEHIDYIERFIEQKGLRQIILVLHGWGSVVGFEYARRHPENVRGLIFYEAHVRPVTEWNMLSLPVQQFAALLTRQGASYRAVMKQNYLVEKLLPQGMMQKLTAVEMDAYRQPFPTIESRKPLWQYIQDLPLGKGPDDVIELIGTYSAWLQQTHIAKLMLYAVPGFITTIETVAWARERLHNLTLVALDDALHFAQETMPQEFADAVAKWLNSELAK